LLQSLTRTTGKEKEMLSLLRVQVHTGLTILPMKTANLLIKVVRKVDQTFKTMDKNSLIKKIATGKITENDLPVKLSMFEKQDNDFVNKETGARLNKENLVMASGRGIVFLSTNGLTDLEIETFTNNRA
jgi:hypothetical protein